MEGRFGLKELAEQIRSAARKLTQPPLNNNIPVGNSGPTPISMALAEELGSTLHTVLSPISQQELDAFYGRGPQDYRRQPPTTEVATTAAALVPKDEEREEVAEKEAEQKSSGKAAAVVKEEEEEQKSSGKAAAVVKEEEEEQKSSGKAPAVKEEEEVIYKADQKLHEQLMRKNYSKHSKKRVTPRPKTLVPNN